MPAVMGLGPRRASGRSMRASVWRNFVFPPDLDGGNVVERPSSTTNAKNALIGRALLFETGPLYVFTIYNKPEVTGTNLCVAESLPKLGIWFGGPISKGIGARGRLAKPVVCSAFRSGIAGPDQQPVADAGQLFDLAVPQLGLSSLDVTPRLLIRRERLNHDPLPSFTRSVVAFLT